MTMGMPGVRCMNVLSTIDILQVKSNRKMKCQNRAAKSTNIEVQFIPMKSTSLSFKLLTGNQPCIICYKLAG
jgi:PP-loop superfamily ATP-utilizing enzyme